MSDLRFTNSLTNRTEPFEPLNPGKATIYCCGVTVYDLCHLGHARSYINWDVLRRYLIWRGYDVTYVQNYTDIDDCCIEGIQTLISELEAKGAAYSSDGDVYFDISKAKDYGKLSGREINDQQQGASGRTADGEESRKKHPFDFALWKGSKAGEQSWDSPWGPGRPGWHIECSAMVRQELGLTIDIHLGGGDLVFPHHENEIAQSETANDAPLARLWMHNGMVNVGGTKMSKSLGNFTTIRALLESGLSAMALRLFVLQAHYRKPLDFTDEALNAATTGWKGLNAALKLGETQAEALGWGDQTELSGQAVRPERITTNTFEAQEQRFITAMNDDINSSGALAVLFELARPLKVLANRIERGDQPQEQRDELTQLHERWMVLRKLSAVLGLRSENNSSKSSNIKTDTDAIEQEISNRNAAKQDKNYVEADRIRNELLDQGIELIDKQGGLTEWIQH